jgi:RNA polymerase primary sigma factor
VSEGGEDLAEPAGAVEQPEDLVWEDDESAALRHARTDATLAVSTGSVRQYLKQIGKVALLTAEQEVALAERIEVGLYAVERLHRAVDSTEKLSPRLRRDLCWIVREGQSAKNHLLEANLRLVVSLAKRYTGFGDPDVHHVQQHHVGVRWCDGGCGLHRGLPGSLGEPHHRV